MQPDFSKLDPLLTDRTRLAILSTLAAEGVAVDFKTLLTTLSLTSGNLSVHADKLETSGLITIKKKFAGKVPQTTYTCTAEGRKALLRYLEQIEKILAYAKKGDK